MCVKGITNRRPPKVLWDDIIQILGETPNGSLVAICFKEWVARGHNPMNMAWLLEWYPAGGPASQGQARASPAQRSAVLTDEDLAELAAKYNHFDTEEAPCQEP
jgi:hypothetical protein